MDSEVPISIRDYLIDQAGIDWSATLTPWSWLVPSEFTLWLVTRIADLFLVMPDGTVHMLDVGNGSLEKIAESREDFAAKTIRKKTPTIGSRSRLSIDLWPQGSTWTTGNATDSNRHLFLAVSTRLQTSRLWQLVIT